MLLTIRAAIPESDFGYLLHKNPSHLHSFELAFGNAHVFFTERGQRWSEVALLVDVDPVGLVRGHGAAALDQYVNDRPYAASSLLSVALARVFGTAMSGRSKQRQATADTELDLEAVISAIPCRGGDVFLQKLFEPLGYQVTSAHYPLDERFPEWGEGPYFTVRLRGHVRLRELLTHLYVLIPVLDAEKHYWVGEDEVEKLLRKGAGWLASHPEKEIIAARYLKYSYLTRDALARLADEDAPDPEAAESGHYEAEIEIEKPLRLWEQRIGCVLSVLRAANARSVVDLGCGEGKLLKALLSDRSFERIVGMDVSWRGLEGARKKLYLDQLSPTQRKRIELMHGSLMYRDKRLSGFDVATVIEVIEHLDTPRLAAFERVLFENARPGAIVITTPNVEYNRMFPTLPVGEMRHKDHRFEWTREQFRAWAAGITERFRYQVRFLPVGPEIEGVGAPTQMGVFTR